MRTKACERQVPRPAETRASAPPLTALSAGPATFGSNLACMLGPAESSTIERRGRDGIPAAWQFGPRSGADDGHDDLRRQEISPRSAISSSTRCKLIDTALTWRQSDDTANVYSGGGSKSWIGEAMGQAQARHADRDQGALSDGGGQAPLTLAPHPECELKRLRTDVIDLIRCISGRPDAARGDDGGADSLVRSRCATSAVRTGPAGT